MSINSSINSLFKQIEPSEPTMAKVPGKLYIAGEYAILFPKQPAILIAVNQFLTARVTASRQNQCGTIKTDLSNMNSLNYERKNGMMHFDHALDSDWHYVINAVSVTLALIQSLGLTVRDFNMSYQSELVSRDGLKFGFGSSGAVVVATIDGLLKFHGLQAIDRQLIFKLAAIALTKSGSNGSMGDIATIVTGGWVYYQSFDRQWLKEQLATDRAILSLLLAEWPHLVMESLTVPNELSLLIGWTQSPASTENLVAQLLKQDVIHDETFTAFLAQSAQSVDRLLQGFKQNRLALIESEIQAHRQLLLNLAKTYQLNIETKQLTQLINLARSHNFSAKSSGAGGGDCGIAIGSLENPSEQKQLIQAWQDKQIMVLPLEVTAPYS